jgi:MFS family permease
MTLRDRLGLPRTGGSRPLLAAILIDATGSGLWAPFALLYFHDVAGLRLSSIGAALTIAAVFTVPLAFASGTIADRFGARRVVSASQVLQGAGFLLYTQVHDVRTMVLATAITAAGNRVFWSSYFTLIAEVAERHERDRWYGLAGAVQNVGYAAGGLAAGVVVGLAATTGYRALVLVDAASFLLAAGLIGWGGRASRPGQPDAGARKRTRGAAMSLRLLVANRPYATLIAANAGFAVCSVMLAIGVPVYAVVALGVPAWTIGALFAANTALLALLQTVVVRRLEPHRRTGALALAGALWAGWSVLLAFAVGVPSSLVPIYVVGATALYVVAELIHAPTSNALAAAAAPDDTRGSHLAAFQLSWTLATLVSPALFTALFSLRPAYPWLVVACVAMAAAAATFALDRHLPAPAVRAPATLVRSGADS